jgi:hypothetical protein
MNGCVGVKGLVGTEDEVNRTRSNTIPSDKETILYLKLDLEKD